MKKRAEIKEFLKNILLQEKWRKVTFHLDFALKEIKDEIAYYVGGEDRQFLLSHNLKTNNTKIENENFYYINENIN